MIRSLAAILLMSATCLAQNAPAQNLQTRMDEIVQTFVANKQFMGAVLVARGDEVLLSKGYGSANLEWEIPNTPTTKVEGPMPSRARAAPSGLPTLATDPRVRHRATLNQGRARYGRVGATPQKGRRPAPTSAPEAR